MKRIGYNFLYCCLALLALQACKKTDNFKTKLDTLPQINNEDKYAYLPAYGIGDTMTIVGRLQPQNKLNIQIGQVEAQIVKTDTISYRVGSYPDFKTEIMDIVKVIISEKMGIGAGRSVKITSGDYSINGADIEIYNLGGEGSFANPLKIIDHAAMSSSSNVFLHCINGKGDIYLFDVLSKSLQQFKKDGTIVTLLSQSELNRDQHETFSIDNFVAGGVDPKGENAWFSIQTPAGYRFCKANFATRSVTTLNQSNSFEAPYEGVLAGLKTIITGVYPDNKGTIYVTLGANKARPQAIAKINDSDGRLKFIFKSKYATADMPGNNFLEAETKYGPTHYRFLPTEGSLYVFSTRIVIDRGESSFSPGIGIYSLVNGLKSKDLVVQNEGQAVPSRYIGPFRQMRMNLNFNKETMDAGGGFGYLPMPGQRLQFLFTQYLDGSIVSRPGNIAAQYEFPKWMVLDFKNERSYQYAPGRLDIGAYLFAPYFPSGEGLTDELLNYDETGALYMSAKRRTVIAKTAIK